MENKNRNFNLDVSELHQGVYFINMETEGRSTSKKLIKF